MSLTILDPVSDYATTGWTNTGGAASFSVALSDASDSTYAVASVAGDFLELTLGALPGDFGTATAVTVNVRAKSTSSKHEVNVTAQVNQSSNSTALTNAVTAANVTTSFANYMITLTPSGTQTAAAWTNAILVMALSSSQSGGDSEVSEASVTVSYTATSGPSVPTPLFAPGVMGLGTVLGMPNQQRRSRVEGIRYNYD